MAETDDAVPAHDEGDPLDEIHGPESEVERIVQRASPVRLALRVAIAAILLGCAVAGAWQGRAWWAGREPATPRGP